MRFATYATVVVCLGLPLTACDVKVGENGVSVDVSRGKAEDEWTRTYKLAKGGRLEVVNVNGLIEVVPATGSDVEVVAHREVRARNDEESKEVLAKAEMIEDVGPDHVKVELKTGSPNSGFNPRSRVNIRYRVSVPAGLNSTFRTENGAVRVENVEGRLTLVSTNGPVVARGVSGTIDASTVNGGIEIGMLKLTGDSKIVTVNGPASLILAPNINADLEAAAVNGGVTTQDGLPLTATDRTGRHVAGRFNDGGPRISVQTTNGGVRVGMTGDFARGRGQRRRGRETVGG
jgi:hypothetical protein